MNWLGAATEFTKQGVPFVIVTIAALRGHAPRGAGAKMLVTQESSYGSIGGGNLEQTAIEKAREYLGRGGASLDRETLPLLFNMILNPKGGAHGVQCCGGEVTLLLELVNPKRPTVAIFGAGHVGWAIAHILQTLPLELLLIDSREKQLDETRLLTEQPAEVHLQHAAIPETALESIPAGAHLLILTHDHAEDIAILERALRRDDLGFIGLIGSSAKWAHFQGELKKQGLTDSDLERVTTPIGLPGIEGKSPAVIAIATAAQLLQCLELSENLD